MADPVVELEPVTAAVEPGGQARVVVTVVNEGSIVEGYRVEVLDDLTAPGHDVAGPASWSEVLPAEGGRAGADDEPDVTVFPGQQQSVVVVFAPPVGTRAPGGRCAFAVRVSSVVDPDTSTVVEGDLDIGKVTALQAKLVPVTSTGRWRGRHVVELSNWGNVPVRLRLVAEDPDRALGFLVRPDTVELPVGASQPVRLSVRTRRPRLRGPATRLPFTVRAQPADDTHAVPATPAVTGVPAVSAGVVVDGAFSQKSIVTTGAVLGAGLALAAVAGLTAYGLMQRTPAETFEEQGPPPTPEGVSVEATGPDSVLVSWAPVDQIEGYKLFQVEEGAATGVQELDPGLGALPVKGLVPDQEYCFTLVAVRGEAESPRSEEACTRTEKAPAEETTEPVETTTAEQTSGEQTSGEETPSETGAETTQPTETTTSEPTQTTTSEPTQTTTADPTETTTAPPTTDPPVFAAGEWASVLATFPAQGSAGEFDATQRADALLAEGVAALAVDTEDYPDLGFAQQGWLVVIEEGYATSVEAAQACQDVNAAVPALVAFCDPPVQPIGP